MHVYPKNKEHNTVITFENYNIDKAYQQVYVVHIQISSIVPIVPFIAFFPQSKIQWRIIYCI